MSADSDELLKRLMNIRAKPIYVMWTELTNEEWNFIKDSTIYPEIEFWMKRNDWDTDRNTPPEQQNFMTWGSQAFLKLFFNDVWDERRPELDRKILSCLFFIRLLNFREADTLSVGNLRKDIRDFVFFRDKRGAKEELLFGGEYYQIPFEEKSGMFNVLPRITEEELDKLDMAFNFRRLLIQMFPPNTPPLPPIYGIPLGRYGGQARKIPQQWVALTYRTVVDMEQKGMIGWETKEAINNLQIRGERNIGWMVPFQQIESDKEVNLYPFGATGVQPIFSYNYATYSFRGVR